MKSVSRILVLGVIILGCLMTLPVYSEGSNDGKKDKKKKKTYKPVEVGSKIPKVKVKTPLGAKISLRKMAKKQPTILIFYRGGWCPFCNKHLKEIQEIYPQLEKLGYQVIAVSPDKPSKLRESMEKLKPTYLLLSDSKIKAAERFGLAFTVDDKTLEKYNEFGIDLEAASGKKHHKLPVPAAFVLKKDGTVAFMYKNENYKDRVSGKVLLEEAKKAL